MKKTILIILIMHCLFHCLHAENREEALELITFIKEADSMPFKKTQERIIHYWQLIPDSSLINSGDTKLQSEGDIKLRFESNKILFLKIIAVTLAIRYGMINDIKPIITQQFIDELVFHAKKTPIIYWDRKDGALIFLELFCNSLENILAILKNNPQEDEQPTYNAIQYELNEILRIRKQSDATGTIMCLGFLGSTLLPFSIGGERLDDRERLIFATMIFAGWMATILCGYFTWQYFEPTIADATPYKYPKLFNSGLNQRKIVL